MPSKNMLPKGHRHRSVRAEYVATRGVEPEMPPIIPVLEFDDDADDTTIRTFAADPAATNMRIDMYLAQAMPDISRARLQALPEPQYAPPRLSYPSDRARGYASPQLHDGDAGVHPLTWGLRIMSLERDPERLREPVLSSEIHSFPGGEIVT